ncbi:hypothetical protein K461DRAFT_266501 [Myriangium duriaei CBS 260.36]|uniref:ABM domain-containing protein n=1 Tax=Myriangium duriaei CBS 260.36 TaxID=1168546 RepID=A0A9P4J8R8_9PEZI|nr:hypothetical protein K461DRAFT_266501 [Myriangium duriaei CBS 260.36]
MVAETPTTEATTDATPKQIATFLEFEPVNGAGPLDDTGTDPSDCSPWEKLMQPFLSAPGHFLSHWGRIVERPSHTLMISSWHTLEEWSAFRGSEEYRLWESSLQKRCTVPLVSYLVDFDNAPFDTHLEGYTAITEVQVQQHASDERIRGLIKKSGGGFSGSSSSPYRGHPNKGTVLQDDGVGTIASETSQRVLLLQYWNSRCCRGWWSNGGRGAL